MVKEIKERCEFWITQENKKVLKTASKCSGHSIGKILNALIEQKLADPIQVLRDKARTHAREIKLVTDEIALLEELKKEQNVKTMPYLSITTQKQELRLRNDDETE